MSPGPASPPGADAVPPDVVGLRDFEAHARARLSPQAWAYFAGGAGDERTLHANARAWQELALHPRVLRDLRGGHTRVTLLGRSCAHPILVAPMACQTLAHPQGESAMALAAAMQGAGMVLSAQASQRLEDVAALVRDEPTRGPLWFQLYLQPERAHTLELVQRARETGYEAMVLTVDAPVSGARDRERRAGFRLPAAALVNLSAPLVPAGASSLFGGSRAGDAGLAATAARWDDVAWLCAQAGLPVLLKGITHPDDAREALALGAAGLIVSNHGGRTLDTMPATAALLPAVVQAVQGRCPVLVDGGIARGTDVLKAIGLGASAVLVGRPMLWALATAGAPGVACALRVLRDELEMAMALCGCKTLAEAAQALG